MTERKLLQQIIFPIRWVDMDAYRHVGNQRYFDAMTETRAQWLRQHIAPEVLNQYLYFVAETHCQFLKAFKYPGTMAVQQYIADLGRTHFSLEYEFYLVEAPDEPPRAKGMARMVCVDPKTERPAKIPESVLKLLS